MAEEFVDVSLLWNDDDSWSFPVLATEEDNGGKELIVDGKIVLDVGGSDGNRNEGSAVAPPPVNRKRRSDDQGNDGGDGEGSNHEQHILSERERRKKMSDMFATLHSLIPHIKPKADKSTIVDKAVDYIKDLEKTLNSLKKRKEMLKGKDVNPTDSDDVPTITQPKPAVQSRETILGEQAGSSSRQVVTLKNPNSLFSGFEFPATFESYGLENVTVNICGKDAHFNVCCSTRLGLVSAIGSVMEKYKIEVVSAHVSCYHNTRMYMIHARQEISSVNAQQSRLIEEIFKQAASEIFHWLKSPN